MPYSIRTKDGLVVQNIPDDVPPDHDSLKKKVELLRTQIKMDRENAAFAKEVADPNAGVGFLEKVRAGAGKGFADLGRGVAQLVGSGPTGEEVKETRRLDAPLMNTVPGIVGNIGANVATLAPLALVPGANTVAGAGAIGAVSGLVQPAVSTGDRLKNTAMGGALGAGTQYLGSTGAQKLGEWSARKSAEQAAQKSQNQVADETLRLGREAGYKLPPSAVNDSWLGRRLESIGGKAAINQDFSLANQRITDKLGREAAGLGPNQAISVENLKEAKTAMAQPYRDIASLNEQAARQLEALKAARHESNLQWQFYNRTGDPSAYKAAQAAKTEIERIESELARHAQNAGRSELVTQLPEARRRIAQNIQVAGAANRGTGNVAASDFGEALARNEKLSGPLETIARFQQAYPRYMTEATKVPTPGVSKSEALASALLASQGAQAAGKEGLLAGGLPLISGPVRKFLMSDAVQNAVMTPTYQPGMLQRLTAGLNDPAVNEKLSAILRSGALTMVPPMAAQ